MPKNKRLRSGIGAVVSVYKRFLHPRALLSSKYPNAAKADVLDGLLVVGQEEKMIWKRLQTRAIIAIHCTVHSISVAIQYTLLLVSNQGSVKLNC